MHASTAPAMPPATMAFRGWRFLPVPPATAVGRREGKTVRESGVGTRKRVPRVESANPPLTRRVCDDARLPDPEQAGNRAGAERGENKGRGHHRGATLVDLVMEPTQHTPISYPEESQECSAPPSPPSPWPPCLRCVIGDEPRARAPRALPPTLVFPTRSLQHPHTAPARLPFPAGPSAPRPSAFDAHGPGDANERAGSRSTLPLEAEKAAPPLISPFPPPLSHSRAGRRHRLVQDLGVHARHPDQGCAPWHQEHHRRHLPQLRHRHGPGQGALFEKGEELIFPLPCPPSAELPAGCGCRGERPPPRVRGKAIRHKPRCAVAAGLGDEEPRETAAEVGA
jgi:hypothetical protein